MTYDVLAAVPLRVDIWVGDRGELRAVCTARLAVVSMGVIAMGVVIAFVSCGAELKAKAPSCRTCSRPASLLVGDRWFESIHRLDDADPVAAVMAADRVRLHSRQVGAVISPWRWR